MRLYHTFHPDHEVRGQALLDFKTAAGDDIVRLFFEKHRLMNLNAEAWYPAQRWFDVVNDMRASGASAPDCVQAGKQWAATLFSAPQWYGLHVRDVLLHLALAYRATNRGTAIGDVTCDVLGPTHVRLTFRMPHPDDFWYGVCCGIMERVTAQGVTYQVYYDSTAPRRDTDHADTTIIHVEWS
ncbi:MAG: DUF2378 family protein [Anaerolineae bacterium]|nr:DUF2378 family protein [Anaerolineae bacterium]